VVKKYLPYIIVAIVFLLAGKFLFGRSNSNIDDRISKLEGISTEIRNAQRSTDTSIKSLGLGLSGIRSDTIKLNESNKRLEGGINKLSENDRRNAEVIGNLVKGNTELKELAKDYRETTNGFGQLIERIEEGNKEIKD